MNTLDDGIELLFLNFFFYPFAKFAYYFGILIIINILEFGFVCCNI